MSLLAGRVLQPADERYSVYEIQPLLSSGKAPFCGLGTRDEGAVTSALEWVSWARYCCRRIWLSLAVRRRASWRSGDPLLLQVTLNRSTSDWYNEVCQHTSRNRASGIRVYQCRVIRFRRRGCSSGLGQPLWMVLGKPPCRPGKSPTQCVSLRRARPHNRPGPSSRL
jgi:hypothetical protein